MEMFKGFFGTQLLRFFFTTTESCGEFHARDRDADFKGFRMVGPESANDLVRGFLPASAEQLVKCRLMISAGVSAFNAAEGKL